MFMNFQYILMAHFRRWDTGSCDFYSYRLIGCMSQIIFLLSPHWDMQCEILFVHYDIFVFMVFWFWNHGCYSYGYIILFSISRKLVITIAPVLFDILDCHHVQIPISKTYRLYLKQGILLLQLLHSSNYFFLISIIIFTWRFF